nr:hypothetical protein CFP56_16657 [Quercus suber]
MDIRPKAVSSLHTYVTSASERSFVIRAIGSQCGNCWQMMLLHRHRIFHWKLFTIEHFVYHPSDSMLPERSHDKFKRDHAVTQTSDAVDDRRLSLPARLCHNQLSFIRPTRTKTV